MTALFYTSAAVAIFGALMTVTRRNAVHALLSLALMFVALASVFWTLGAPFAAVLEIVVYAGAIIVLFVFVVMMLNQGERTAREERTFTSWVVWLVPVALAALLFGQFLYTVFTIDSGAGSQQVPPQSVGVSLFTTYLIGVELASLLLLAGLVAAFHYGSATGPEEGSDGQHTA